MKIKESKPDIKPGEITYKVKRTKKVTVLEFKEALTKEESDKVGEIMLAYEQERQRLIKRLSDLEDVKMLNGQAAGQPLGVIVPDTDVAGIKQELGL